MFASFVKKTENGTMNTSMEYEPPPTDGIPMEEDEEEDDDEEVGWKFISNCHMYN